MPQIDYTYFQKRLTAIPNLSQEEILSDVNDYIEEYDNKYMVKVLGQSLYDDYLNGLEQPTIDNKWIYLRDGIGFEYNGVKYKWNGFINANKKSPIAYYVMWHYVRDNNTFFTGIGTAKSNSENSIISDPNRRMVDIWNKMADDNRILALYLYSNRELYPNYKLFNCNSIPFYPISTGYGWQYCAECDVLTDKLNIYGI